MAVHKSVNLDIPEAKLLADLNGISIDLVRTIATCGLWLAKLAKIDEERQDSIILEALMFAAVVRYARAFATGVRKGRDLVLEGLSEKQKVDHEYFMELRNKYIAHSVNPYEENQVGVTLIPEESGKRGISGISVYGNRVVSIDADDVKRLKELSLYFLDKVTLLIKDEKQKVLAVARSLPIDDLYKKEIPQFKRLTRKDAKKRRK